MAGAQLRRVSIADRIFCLSGKIPVRGFHADSTRRRCFPTTDRLEIFVYFDRALPELERTIGADALALGCTPVVNLFPQRCEPIRLTHTDIEYRIVPDARRPTAMEVWQVERVRETLPDGSSRPWRPFYRLTHGDRDSGGEAGFYHLARRPNGGAADRQRGVYRSATTRSSTPTPRAARCCRSTRCASTAICRWDCLSAAATRRCGWPSRCRAWPSFPA